jgi:hypothetical protein
VIGRPDLGGEPPHPVELGLRRRDVLARRARARELEHAAPELAERAAEPEQLVLGRERAGTGSPEIARCAIVRDVEKPSAPAATPCFTIAAICAMSSGVAGALFAPRSPITYARTAPCGTCVPRSMVKRRRASASRYSGKLSHSHCMPSCSAVPGMSSTPSMSWIRKSCWSGRTGAKPTPQLPITAVVTPW